MNLCTFCSLRLYRVSILNGADLTVKRNKLKHVATKSLTVLGDFSTVIVE